MTRYFKNTRAFAFVLGLVEHWGGCGGRTHDTDQDWNEAYDRGMNLADTLRRREA